MEASFGQLLKEALFLQVLRVYETLDETYGVIIQGKSPLLCSKAKLWSHVLCSSAWNSRVQCVGSVAEVVTNAEVSHRYVIPLHDEEIGGFDVAVDKAKLMHMVKACKQLASNTLYPCQWQGDWLPILADHLRHEVTCIAKTCLNLR